MSTVTYETRAHARALTAYGAERTDAIVLSADLTSSTEADAFRDAYPDRFVSMGMAEQNMMSFAGGLAREGLRPLVHDFAVFMYRRALDQIEMSIAYPNLPVSIIGFLPGLTTPGGVSHQAINDVAVMRSIPNMAVIEAGDAADVDGALYAADQHQGPVYVRMIRGRVPRLFDTPMEFGKARTLHHGGELLVLSSGISTEYVTSAVDRVRRLGVDIGHIHISTLKPFDDSDVIEQLAEARQVVTVENHSIIGGLGSAVAEVLAAQPSAAQLHRVGLADTYLHGASREYLLNEHGIGVGGIVHRIATILELDLHDVAESDASISVTPDGLPREVVTTPDEAL